tara:strand:+ start:200 stop:826 length:627 start_codon:yes stop_codon:yes gene_type:complete
MKKNLYIFDLDGVLIDSKENMKMSWNYVQKKFFLNQNFDAYFSQIGKPFPKILKDLKIKKKIKEIYKDYNFFSINNEKKIKLYPGVKTILRKLNRNNLLAIVTSKNKQRTSSILKKYKLKFDLISTPNLTLKGKPNPDQINSVIQKLKVNKKRCVYIGDTNIDYLTAKRAKIGFIYASYGYGKVMYKKNIFRINSFKKILKYKFDEKN